LHRIVWIAANGVPEEGWEIHHLNHNTKDNRLINLDLVHWQEHRKRHRKVERDTLLEEKAAGLTQRAMAEKYGLSLTRIWQIINKE
jgi:hypothetical protein